MNLEKYLTSKTFSKFFPRECSPFLEYQLVKSSYHSEKRKKLCVINVSLFCLIKGCRKKNQFTLTSKNLSLSFWVNSENSSGSTIVLHFSRTISSERNCPLLSNSSLGLSSDKYTFISNVSALYVQNNCNILVKRLHIDLSKMDFNLVSKSFHSNTSFYSGNGFIVTQ